jgi:hypothetical protein
VELSNGVPAALTPVIASWQARPQPLARRNVCRGSAMLFAILGYGPAVAGRDHSSAGVFL